MKKRTILMLVGISLLFVVTCRHLPNDVPTPIGNNPNPANVKDSVCFVEEILPLLVSNCAKSGCHDAITATEGVVLNSYPNVISTISGIKLKQVIQANGSDAMPPLSSGPRLSTTQISLVKAWVNQGMLNGIDCQCNIDTNNVTFSSTIWPIIQNNCLGCHTNTVPVLTNYGQIKSQVDTGRLYSAINHTGGVVPMPLNAPQLSACKVTAFNKWVNNGAPNN